MKDYHHSPPEKHNPSAPNTFSGTRANRLPSYIGSVLTFQYLTDRHLKKKQKQKKNKGTGHTTPIRRHTARSQTSIMKECQLPLRTTSETHVATHRSLVVPVCMEDIAHDHGTPNSSSAPLCDPLASRSLSRGSWSRRSHRGHGQDKSEAAPSE